MDQAISPSLGVTQRYMHLSPAALDAAIRLLDNRSVAHSVAQADASEGKLNG